MNEAASFDVLAPSYDKAFTESLTGSHQRRMGRKWLLGVLQKKPGLDVLEINCGTGEDALWLASMGHRVQATDVSECMIMQAEKKPFPGDHPPRFSVCAFDELPERFQAGSFDLVFSNFGGLNCLNRAGQLRILKDINRLLKPGGHAALVVFGKKCLWERVYYLLKRKPPMAFRRKGREAVRVELAPEVFQDVYYYGVDAFRNINGFRLEAARPVGLFVPPSYLEGLMRKYPVLFWVLSTLERLPGAGFTAELADHSYILLKKDE